MTAPRDSQDGADAIRAAAARWTVRRDRGLSASESIEFELWLAADPRHGAALQRAAGSWALLDRVPDAVAQRQLAAAARRRFRLRWLAVGSSLAAAAALALAAIRFWPETKYARVPAAGPALAAAGPRSVTLADGSLVRLNQGGVIVEEFNAAERRVRLTRGEAHFTVTKNPARPFIVSAGPVRVRAVGTAFNVNLQAKRIEVLVTEGKVELHPMPDPAARPADGAGPATFLVANEEAAVDAAGGDVSVRRLDPAEVSRTLAWQDSLLRLGGATLAEIVAEFERHTAQRVRLADPSLAQLRMGGRFRADDLEGFTRLLATAFDLETERAADGVLVLRKKNAESR